MRFPSPHLKFRLEKMLWNRLQPKNNERFSVWHEVRYCVFQVKKMPWFRSTSWDGRWSVPSGWAACDGRCLLFLSQPHLVGTMREIPSKSFSLDTKHSSEFLLVVPRVLGIVFWLLFDQKCKSELALLPSLQPRLNPQRLCRSLGFILKKYLILRWFTLNNTAN